MNNAILRYFDRAAWSVHNASNPANSPVVKSHLTAMAIHACQSLMEALEQWADGCKDSRPPKKISQLPHRSVIENIRNLDLHGWPIPICLPNVRARALKANPKQPFKVSSSHGVEVSIQMNGLRPVQRRTPKDLKHGKIRIGSGTISYGCEKGEFIVHDFSTGKDYIVLRVLESFLNQCRNLIASRCPAEDSKQEATPD